MSIVLRHGFLVRDLFAVPFQTRHGVGFHYISRNSVLHVHQKVPIASLKRFPNPQKVLFKHSKPSQTKPDPVHEKPPVQARCTIKNATLQNQERELLDGSITVENKSSQTKPDNLVQEKLFQVLSTIKTVPRKNPKREQFAGSVTMVALDRRLIKESSKQTT